MTKAELLAELEAAGVEGYSMDNTKAELEEAVAGIGVHTKPADWVGHDHLYACWCGRVH